MRTPAVALLFLLLLVVFCLVVKGKGESNLQTLFKIKKIVFSVPMHDVVGFLVKNEPGLLFEPS